MMPSGRGQHTVPDGFWPGSDHRLTSCIVADVPADESFDPWAFAKRPRWIASHVLVIALVITMIGLGFWQIARHGQKAELVDQYESSGAAQPILLDPSAFSEGMSAASDRTAWRYRAGAVRGEFRADEQILVGPRARDGAPGAWVVTPLDIGNETTVAVVRGWANEAAVAAGPRSKTLAPPTGQVTAYGQFMPSEAQGAIGATEPPGERDEMIRLDIDRLGQQIDGTLFAWFLQATEIQDPSGDPILSDVVTATPPEKPSTGPHLGYAGQWFIFTLIALIGYRAILRRERDKHGGNSEGAKRRRRASAVPWDLDEGSGPKDRES